jgi:uncharacterized membrane protein YhhN
LPAFDAGFWALVAITALAALAYGLFFLDRAPSALRVTVKTAFAAALAAALLNIGVHPLLFIALCASAAGDFFLGFDKRALLPLGILSFLIAQLCYLVIFFFSWIFAGDLAPLWPRYLFMGVVIAAALAALIWLAPKLKWMALGVVPYTIAIAAMACAAMWQEWRAWPAMLGAALFVVSDLVLAGELFRIPENAPIRRITAPVVWWTYVGAQALIVTGLLLGRS